ncbi:hypothetical protein BCR43DRAFT_566967 [Syncephalastrum racemosum]|uniref:Uncharacterized protein n=1 Tax=Syncephalastrum racemosum TaxID=13706 RepID=A0A1X2H015_SYNRA|nr:hypothetical protein BCR43DRAFT_566967 [Syncephalastrum racemosum]
MEYDELHLGRLKLKRLQPMPALFPHMTRIKPPHFTTTATTTRSSTPTTTSNNSPIVPIVYDLQKALESYERYWGILPSSFHDRQHTISTASSFSSRSGSVVSDDNTTHDDDDIIMGYADKPDRMDLDAWCMDWDDPNLSIHYKEASENEKKENKEAGPHHGAPRIYGAPWKTTRPRGTAQIYRDDKLCRMVSKALDIDPERLDLCDRRTLYTLDHLDALSRDLKAKENLASFFDTMRAHTSTITDTEKEHVAHVQSTLIQKQESALKDQRRSGDPKEKLERRLDILNHPEAAALSAYGGSLRTSGKTFFIQCLLTELSKLDEPVHVVILTHDLEMENILLRYLRDGGFRGQRLKTVLEDILHNLHGVYVSSEKSSSNKRWSKVDLLISFDIRSSPSDLEHVLRVSEPPPRILHVVTHNSFEQDVFSRMQALWSEDPSLSWKRLFDQDQELRRLALIDNPDQDQDDTHIETYNLHEAQRVIDWFLRKETHDTLPPSSTSPPPPTVPPALHHVLFADQVLPLPTFHEPDPSLLEDPSLGTTCAEELGKIQEEYKDKLIQLRQQLMERVLHVLEK